MWALMASLKLIRECRALLQLLVGGDAKFHSIFANSNTSNNSMSYSSSNYSVNANINSAQVFSKTSKLLFRSSCTYSRPSVWYLHVVVSLLLCFINAAFICTSTILTSISIIPIIPIIPMTIIPLSLFHYHYSTIYVPTNIYLYRSLSATTWQPSAAPAPTAAASSTTPSQSSAGR